MKQNLKRILPILLAIAVVLSIAWYLFVYDREFTRDMLLQQARAFEKNGNHAVAAWLYNQAYLQSENNEAVAIELAQQFKEMGNYTKAEYTLTNAIASGGSAELYVALCRIYVEQDKLLDAVTMLDSITDPAIKAQLDAQRPHAPAVSHAPGFYTQYLNVAVTGGSGKTYVTSDGEYPSIHEDGDITSVTLVGGENTIYALTVGDNGLVSPLGIYGYTVGGVVEKVSLKDPTFDTVLRQLLQVDADTQLYSSDLWTVTELTLPEGAASYEDLKWLPYLTKLTVSDSTGVGLENIAQLGNLKELKITGTVLSTVEFKAIARTAQLEKLTLSGCSLSSLAGLSAARNLISLDLSDNSIRDLTELSFLTGLKELNLSHNALTDVNSLSGLGNLTKLNVSYNSLNSIVPLVVCTKLESLNISNNAIAHLTGIEQLAALKELYAGSNALTDIALLEGCGSLVELDLSHNQLTNLDALGKLNNLENLNFSYNSVTTLPKWDKDKNVLVSIDGSHNSLTTISGLAGYPRLNYVIMDNNSISAVNALATCPNLVRVSVFNNPVKDVSKLKDNGIVVNYNP